MGTTCFDENDFIYVTFMSSTGGDIKFKTEFPQREVGLTTGDEATSSQRRLPAELGVDPDDVRKELDAYRLHNLKDARKRSPFTGAPDF